ncbi:MAG: hypothetical protein ACK559_21525 [bacterium]
MSVVFYHPFFGGDSEYFFILQFSNALDVNWSAEFVIALVAMGIILADLVDLIELEVLNQKKLLGFGPLGFPSSKL